MVKTDSCLRYGLISEVMNFVIEKDIVELEDLLMYARRERFNDWFPLLCDDNNLVCMMRELIDSHHREIVG